MSHKYTHGFTLAELLISISIASLLMTTVLFNYSTFTDNLAVGGAEQDVATAIKQAQTYGINVKETGTNSGQFNYAYGVYFNPASPTSYVSFVDSNNDKKYTVGSGCGSGSTECVATVLLRNGVRISNVCDSSTCYNNKSLSVTFLRPNPDAVIYLTSPDTGPLLTGKVELTSPKGKVLQVTVESTGQVAVQ